MSMLSDPRDSSATPRDDEVARLRVPPHSVEAEQSVLGGLLLDNLAWDRAADLLTDSDFYRYEHKLIYAAIGALVNATKPADVITVFEQLQSHRQGRGLRRPGLPECAGAERAQCCQHAALCRDRARARDPAQADRRQRRDRHQRVQSAGPAVTQILDEAEGRIFKIGEEGSRQRQGFQSMDKLVIALLDRVNELHENGAEDVTGVRTGFYDLDRMTAGLQKGDLIVLAARPSMGKTAFALEHRRARGGGNEGLPVLVFSMEMGASQLALAHGRLARPHRPVGPAHRRSRTRTGSAGRSGGPAEVVPRSSSTRRRR
jgi:replicative DNA helicase